VIRSLDALVIAAHDKHRYVKLENPGKLTAVRPSSTLIHRLHGPLWKC